MAASVDFHSFIGSFVSLTLKSEDRYQGFLCNNGSDESTIGLQYARYYGTEGHRMDGPQIPPSDRICQWIHFRRCEIKSLERIHLPHVNRTSDLPDVPAVIQDHNPHCDDTSMSIVPSTSENSRSSSPPQETHRRTSVFVSDEVLIERLLELHKLLKDKILGPVSSDSSNTNAQGPGC